jgi:hypothetical protein
MCYLGYIYDISLFLKHTFPLAANLGTSLENILIVQNYNKCKNNTLAIVPPTHLKHKMIFTSHAVSFMSNCHISKVPSVNIAGDGFTKGDNIRDTSSKNCN